MSKRQEALRKLALGLSQRDVCRSVKISSATIVQLKKFCRERNISFLEASKLSDEELIAYYKKCKVFALPSLLEGVGMVALEAAAYGAEIVLTNIGAPKEYWDGHAELVNPYNIDDIGKAIVKCLNKDLSQSLMLNFIRENYSLEACTRKLLKALE